MPDPAPELAAAAKRIAALEADVGNLRRGMVQQLTATGRLVQQALTLDTRFFGGRYLSGRQPSPQEELGIAADILAAAGAELEKRGGPAPVAGTAVTEVLRAELVAREAELADMRGQWAVLQEEHAAIVAGLETRVDQAEERAAAAEAAQRDGANDDDRRSDRAEIYGLCAELLRVLQSAPAGGDDIAITLQVLDDALQEDGALGTVCQAAESALVSWAAALAKEVEDAKTAAAGLDGLRATAGEWQKQAAQLRTDLERARAEAAKSAGDAKATAERSSIIEREITKLQSERETLVRDVERLQVELGEQRRAAHEANMARSRDRQETEAFRARAKDEAEQVVAQAIAEATAARQEAERLSGERDQLQGRLSNTQERVDRLEAERERAGAELVALRRELDAQRAASEAAQAEAAQLKPRLSAAEAAIERSQAELKAAQSTAEAAGARERSAAERVERLQGERDRLVAERERALAEGGGLKRDLDTMRGERDGLKSGLADAAKAREMLIAERDRLVAERERAGIELAQVRKELEATRAAAERVTSERDTLRSRQAAADGAAEAAMRERDQAKGQIANAAAERDRFRAALEAAQEERSALTRSKDEQAAQFTLRLTESSRQLGEMKQVHARLAHENDRLTAELELLRKAAERGKTDAAELKRRAEELAEDRRRLAELEARATAAEERAAGLPALTKAVADAQVALGERDAQLAQAVAEVKRLGEGLAAATAQTEAERTRFADAVALLKQARGAVEEAKRQTASFDVVQAELARLRSASSST